MFKAIRTRVQFGQESKIFRTEIRSVKSTIQTRVQFGPWTWSWSVFIKFKDRDCRKSAEGNPQKFRGCIKLFITISKIKNANNYFGLFWDVFGGRVFGFLFQPFLCAVGYFHQKP